MSMRIPGEYRRVSRVALSLALTGVVLGAAPPALSQGRYPDPDPGAACRDPIVSEAEHVGSASGSGGPWDAGSFRSWQLYAPNVKTPMHQVNNIVIPANSKITVKACGCVQTGGIGKTWKRYVNPAGPKSDHLYRGLIRVSDPAKLGLTTSPTVPGLVRIQDLMAAQSAGRYWTVNKATTLVLGYEDESGAYGDNGYSGHDDGNPEQCKGVGVAVVGILAVGNMATRSAAGATVP